VFLQKNCLQTVVLWSSHYSESLPNLTSQKTENPSSTDHSLTTHVPMLQIKKSTIKLYNVSGYKYF